ncbi:MAG TPA: hypothetical protein DDX14_07755, partial [Cyanobacteria bacterium UBA9579]|nr:hypothetical protein [Cyanobacteria bacterium UBA9579]
SIACFEKVIQLNPDYAEGYYNLGNSLQEKGEFEKAQLCFQKSVELKSDFTEAYNNLGLILSKQLQFDKAMEYYKKAIDLDPDYCDSYINLGSALNEKGQSEEARKYFHKALEIKPDFAEAYINLGKSFYLSTDLEESEECYQKALLIKPEYADAYFGLALINLLKGNFDKGWEYYEYRFSLYDQKFLKKPAFTKPKWAGESLQNKTILIHHEQGFGDSLQFVRYLPVLHSMGAKVLFKSPKELEELLKQSDLKAEIINNSIVEYDMYAYLMSMPYYLKTDSENIPFKDKYLKANPEKINDYREKYFKTDKFKVGIFWQGRKWYGDKNRSLPLEYFIKLSQLKNIQLYSLQKGDGIEQLENIPSGIDIINLGKTFNDFSDTAAAIENLDLFITIDTSVAHLSAGLGIPTWILLPFTPEWRWGINTNESYWYDSVKLFRQIGTGNWSELMNRVIAEVKRLLSDLT